MINYIMEGIMIFRRYILLGIIVFAVFELILLATKKREKSDHTKRENILPLLCELLLAIYICTILQITGIIGRSYAWNLSSSALQSLAGIPFQGASIRMVALNCLLFVPYGFLVAVSKRRSGISWWKLLLAGFATSFVIEMIQAFTGRLPETDDLIANTAGFLIGLVLARGILELKDKTVRKRGIIKILLTLIIFGASLFALSFWANGDELQKEEDNYYNAYDFNTEKMSQMSRFIIWKDGSSKTMGTEFSEAYDWYSWIGTDISNHSASYKIQDIRSDIKSVIEKDKVYVEMEYDKPQDFLFYNNKSWKIEQITCMLFCVDDGTVWYGAQNHKLEKCARYENPEYAYETDTQLLDEINDWIKVK